MATVFDLGLLSQFADIFAWLLIFVIVYGVLEVTNFLKNRGLHALLAITITVIVGVSGGTAGVVTSLAPWFVVLAFFMVFLLALTNFVGLSNVDLLSSIGGKNAFWWFFTPLAIALVIALISVGQQQDVGGTEIIKDASGNVQAAAQQTPGRVVVETLTDPKVLGLILILAIAAVTVALMAGAHMPS